MDLLTARRVPFASSLFQRHLSWAVRRVLGPADSWLWVPGRERSQSHRLLKEQVWCASGESLPLPTPSALFLLRHILDPPSLCGAGHVEPLWFLVGEEAPSCHQLGPSPGQSLPLPAPFVSCSQPSPVALLPVLALRCCPSCCAELLCASGMANPLLHKTCAKSQAWLRSLGYEDTAPSTVPNEHNLQLLQDNPVAQTLRVTPRDAPFARRVSVFPGAVLTYVQCLMSHPVHPPCDNWLRCLCPACPANPGDPVA